MAYMFVLLCKGNTLFLIIQKKITDKFLKWNMLDQPTLNHIGTKQIILAKDFHFVGHQVNSKIAQI